MEHARGLKLVIDRKTWLRGEGADGSFLRRSSDGRQCCLGFMALAAGLTSEEITDKTTIATVNRDFTNLPHGLTWTLSGVFANSSDCAAAIDKNDKENISDAEREVSIVDIFARNGWDVTFVD